MRKRIVTTVISFAFLALAGVFLFAYTNHTKTGQPNEPAIKSGDVSALGTGNLPKIIKLEDNEQTKTIASPAMRANFGFNAIAPHFKEIPGDTGYEEHRHLKIRVSDDGRNWGEWTDVHTDGGARDNDPHPDEQFPETPIFAEGKYFQFSVTLERPAPNAKASQISDLIVTYIDSRESSAQKISRVMQKALTPRAAVADSPQGPNIVSRAQWGSPDPYGTAFRGSNLEWFPSYVPVTQTFIHHTVNSNYSSDFNSVVRGIWQFQTYTRGWGDIGYNYLVDSNGTVYEGRFGGDNVVGGHALGYNRGSMGVALIGCFQSGGECRSFNGGDVGPNWPMLNSLYNLLGYKLKGYEIDPTGSHTFCGNQDVNYACKGLMNIAGHRDANDTSCPGNLTYDQLSAIRAGAASRKDNLFPYAAKQLSYDTVATVDGQKQVTLQFKNTGTATWSNSSPRFFLKTAAPDDRTSTYQGDDWITSQHAALLNETSVAPGQVGSFTFNMNGSGAPPGSYSYEGFRLVVEGVTELKSYYTVETLAPTLEWQHVSTSYGSGSSLMSPGQTQTVTVTAKNTGTATWHNSGDFPMRISTSPQGASSPFYHSSWLSGTRMATMNQSTVAPGQNATFTFTVRAPGKGEYAQRINLVAENRRVADDNGASIYFRVANQYEWTPVSLSHSTGTAQMSLGDTQTITLVAKNTGMATWSNSGSNPIRLGTWEPNRQSGAYDTTWPAYNRPADMQESSVAPGQNGTFTFTVKP
ncbi:MAG TPA: N-acetylmuramoyl-L-alanine amidase, partial [Candidatus Saccharimonadales bacterium]|nr:N-acetylmuramoyl-L-alanine amidase [Candidatus Saccharimonadales bacterium]